MTHFLSSLKIESKYYNDSSDSLCVLTVCAIIEFTAHEFFTVQPYSPLFKKARLPNCLKNLNLKNYPVFDPTPFLQRQINHLLKSPLFSKRFKIFEKKIKYGSFVRYLKL